MEYVHYYCSECSELICLIFFTCEIRLLWCHFLKVDIVKRRSKLALSVNSQFMSSKTIDSRLEILLPLYIGGLSVPAEVEINMVNTCHLLCSLNCYKLHNF